MGLYGAGKYPNVDRLDYLRLSAVVLEEIVIAKDAVLAPPSQARRCARSTKKSVRYANLVVKREIKRDATHTRLYQNLARDVRGTRFRQSPSLSRVGPAAQPGDFLV